MKTNNPTSLSAYWLLLFIGIATLSTTLTAQNVFVPATAAAWVTNNPSVRFENHRGQAAIYLGEASQDATGSNYAEAKGISFTNGTIEYDVAFEDDTRFTSIQFRRRNADNYEHVYLRSFFVGDPKSSGGLQYAAVVDGVNYWDLSFPYQTGVTMYGNGKWNHVKIIVRDRQLLAYVNDMNRPALYIPILDGEPGPGSVGVDGKAWVANLKVTPDATPGLAAGSGFDPAYNDVRYLRNWQTTAPVDFPSGREPVATDLPDENTEWSPIEAEHHGLVNLSRRFGQTPRGERRLVWLKTTLTARETTERLLRLGISDEAYVYLNGKPLYAAKNLYNTPGVLSPNGRISTDNAQFTLPLREGENELLIGVANFFFGWGIIARLEDGSGLDY